ncbi:MAG: T9SS type A sorting domain-containing protein, partial [Saprospiraceae bacterium]
VTGGIGAGINSSPTIINNTVITQNGYSGFGDGFHIISTLKGNLFISLGSSSWAGIESYHDTLDNNIVYGNWDTGMYVVGTQSADAIVRNNHLEKTQDALRYGGSGSSVPPVFQYNNLWNNNRNYINFTGDSTNIYSDPMFTDVDSMDFHLQKYSPLIDAGDPAILDKDGSRSDIGIYGGPFGEDYKYFDLAPRSPINVTGVLDSEMITIKWNPNTEADFRYYKIFRDTTEGFIADSTTFVLSITDTIYSHIIPPGVNKYYYKLTAVDNQGNESEPSTELFINITSIDDYPITINDYLLYQNYPNPFNPSTKISYRLKERGYVKLYVYDIKGELVSVLVNQNQEAGFYEVEFNVAQESLPAIASGIYIYQIMVRNENNIPVFSDLKKMVFVK